MAQAQVQELPRKFHFKRAPTLEQWYERVWAPFMLGSLSPKHFENWIKLDYSVEDKCYWTYVHPMFGQSTNQDHVRVLRRAREWNKLCSTELYRQRQCVLKPDEYMKWLGEFKDMLQVLTFSALLDESDSE